MWSGWSDSPSDASVSGYTVATAGLIDRPGTWHTEKSRGNILDEH